MKKIFIFGFTLFLLSSCLNTNNTEINSTNNSGSAILEENITKDIKEINKQDKIVELRKKIAVKGLISKGNLDIENQNYTSALIKYIQIYREIPNNKEIIGKLGDIYYNLKKYKQSYSYYSKIKDYNKIDKNRVALSLISSMSLNDENIVKINKELETLNLSKEQLFYYKNSISCKQDFHVCKQNFQDFFSEEENNTGTGNNLKNNNFKELYNIKIALINYENFQIDDLLYKGALLSGAFFENGFYSVAIETSKLLLEEKKDYKPLLKIVAKSYYELGNYIEAKSYLIKYNNLVKKDSEISYFLGVVYEKLNEYMLSTIHFKKALKIGYKDTLDINKRLLYNYYKLDSTEKILQVLKEIIENNDKSLSIYDYNLAIYYHIINNELDYAKQFSIKGLKQYPDSELLNGYYGWALINEINNLYNNDNLILLNSSGSTSTGTTSNKDLFLENKYEKYKKDYDEAEKYINKGLELNKKHPLLNLVKGKLEVIKGNNRKAFIYFKNTISIDNNGNFGKIAKEELNSLKTK